MRCHDDRKQAAVMCGPQIDLLTLTSDLATRQLVRLVMGKYIEIVWGKYVQL